MEHESDGDTNYYWCTWNNPQRFDKGTARLGNKRKSRGHPDYSIIKIGHNTEKSPGNWRRLAVSQLQLRDYDRLFGSCAVIPRPYCYLNVKPAKRSPITFFVFFRLELCLARFFFFFFFALWALVYSPSTLDSFLEQGSLSKRPISHLDWASYPHMVFIVICWNNKPTVG